MGLKAISRLIKGAPDYESGIWTPTLGVTSGTDGVHTYSQNDGYYVRFGDLVWVSASITVSSVDGAMSGDITIKGLPFVNGAAGVGTGFAVSAFVNGNLDTAGGYYFPTATLRNASSDIALREYGDGVSFKALTQADVLSGFAIVITGTYLTNPLAS